MLFCCVWRNIATACHKHFVVVSRHQQTPLLTASDKCHNLPQSGGTVLITSRWWQHLQPAMKPDTGWESRFLPTPPPFNVPVRGFPLEYYDDIWCGKTRMVWLPNGEKILKIRLFVSTEWTNVTDGQTDRHHMMAWGHLCTASHDTNDLDLVLYLGMQTCPRFFSNLHNYHAESRYLH